ncbi:MAG: M15 family metallopeptidase [Desulfofustis sp.]|nr:M15 family metallopeptidase [Desulfofustis sp.]
MQYLVILLSITFFIPAVFASDQPEEVLSIAVDKLPIKYDNVIETVIIDALRYQVPEPWTGNRQFPTSRNLDELKQIPTQYTHEGSEIYILAEAHPPLLEMLEQAHLDGIELKVESAYRSIHYQTRIFIRMLKQGRSFEDIVRYVAPPGYSQHMLGTAMDFYPSNWEFAETKLYRWLQENGAKFGFEETYSKNNRYRMPWEAWHWNYIGEPDIVDEMVAEDADKEDEKTVLTEAAESTVTEVSEIIERDLEPSDTAGSTFAEGAIIVEEVEEGEILSN